MDLWSVFLTGLVAGGASCAAVQGGLLIASTSRGGDTASDWSAPPKPRRPRPLPVQSRYSTSARRVHQRAETLYERRLADYQVALAEKPKVRMADHAAPVGGFLVGKLVSHTFMGGLLGLFGESLQISSGTRAIMQVVAGLLMLAMAGGQLGVAWLARLIPTAPARLTRLVRRSARSEAASAPALLGFLTVLIPCGVTLGVMFLAISSGSPPTGAAIMAVYVIGTSPLFAAIGYTVHRASAWRGSVATLAAVAVLLAGVYTINTGLVLSGSPVSLDAAWTAITDSGPAVAATVDPNRVQQIHLNARNGSYAPHKFSAQPCLKTVLTVNTDNTTGCTRSLVIPSLGIQRLLPVTGDTTIDLGLVEIGKIRFTCSMGMYSGTINVTPPGPGGTS
jgi:uncharacterized protein